MRLKGLDLNLLVALDTLLEEGSVSRAADRLHLSQSAASAALARLREYFGDELLVLHGKRMFPTSYAESLRPKVRSILEDVDLMITASVEFDHRNTSREFRLMASDYITNVLLVPLAARFEKIAPGITLDIRLPDGIVAQDFERGDVDLMLIPDSYAELLAKDHPTELIFVEPHVVVGWKKNPIFKTGMTEDAFYEAGHIAVSIGPKRHPTVTEKYLDAMERKRTITATAPSFAVIPWFLIGTSRLAVMQQRLATVFEKTMPLRSAELPFAVPPTRLVAQYHKSRVADSAIRWLLQELHYAADGLSEE